MRKRKWTILLLLLCLLASGCGQSAREQTGEQETLCADIAQTRESCTGDGSFLDAGDLNAEQQRLLLQYENSYFTAIGSLQIPEEESLFANEEIARWEKAVWASEIAVRQSAVEDLSLSAYSFTLEVTGSSAGEDGLQVSVTENNTQQFRGLEQLSEQYAVSHVFRLVQGEDGAWKIAGHTCDTGAFYHIGYDSETGTDEQLELVLENVRLRQEELEEEPVFRELSADHPYDRQAALAYMQQWVGRRNPQWSAYDASGGNCMNFASQVLYAGGIPMTDAWYWDGDVSYAWCNVDGFTEYTRIAEDYGLVCDAQAGYYSGQVGDLILMGIENAGNHATEICGLVTDASGRTIDYLLCSNTADLRNFPAGAYYYTNQRLVRIFGWND